MFFNTFLLALAITGLILFAYGLKNEQKLSAFFGIIILLVPLIYLTIGINFIAAAPIIGLLIIYYFPSVGEKYSAHNQNDV